MAHDAGTQPMGDAVKFEIEIADARIEAAILAEVKSRLGAYWRNEAFVSAVAEGMVQALADASTDQPCEGLPNGTHGRERALARTRKARRIKREIIDAVAQRATSAGWLRKAAKAAVMAASADTLRGHASGVVSAVMQRLGYTMDDAIKGMPLTRDPD